MGSADHHNAVPQKRIVATCWGISSDTATVRIIVDPTHHVAVRRQLEIVAILETMSIVPKQEARTFPWDNRRR